MIAELAAAALGGFLAAGTGWLLDLQRERSKLEQNRRFLTRAIRDDLTYSLQIYDKNFGRMGQNEDRVVFNP